MVFCGFGGKEENREKSVHGVVMNACESVHGARMSACKANEKFIYSVFKASFTTGYQEATWTHTHTHLHSLTSASQPHLLSAGQTGNIKKQVKSLSAHWRGQIPLVKVSSFVYRRLSPLFWHQ